MTEVVAAERATQPANPFAGPAPSFFERGDRKIHLEKLRHPSQWSRRVLLVTGPRGVGKSALYRQLSSSLETGAKAARINGSLINGAREVLNAMVQGFGLAAPADADAQLLQEVISEHAHDQDESGRVCVTLVDDADMLEPRALEQLMGLAERSPMRVVMFGEVRLVRAVERLAELLDVGWQEIRLNGFTPEEVRDYLQWRFNRVGYLSPMPFSDAQVRELARLSDGLPGRVDQMANVLLKKIRSGATERRVRGFPRQHVALLAVLLVALGLIYLLQPASDPAATSAAADRTGVAVTRIDVPQPGGAAAPAEQAPSAPGTASVSETASAPGTASAPPRASEPATPSQPATTSAPDTTSAAPPAPQPAVAKPQPAPQPTAQPRVEAQSPAAPATAPPAARESAQPARPAPQVARPDPSPALAVSPAGAGSGSRDARWVLAQPATSFTVQLVTLSSPERAAQYVAGQPDPSRFATYRLQRDGRILHVVIYGSFASREQAEAAVRVLPATIGAVQPWIRPFAQVHEAARTALQQ